MFYRQREAIQDVRMLEDSFLIRERKNHSNGLSIEKYLSYKNE